MSLLLDTHVWIWSQENPDELGPAAVEILSDPATGLYVSTVSTLEIARLVQAGTIELDGSLLSWVEESLDALLANTLEISHQIAAEAYELPHGFHKDPADRLLTATARVHDLTLVTADRRILGYPHVRSADARR